MQKLDTNGYGLFLCSIATFSDFLQKHKIRTAKVAAYFDKNKDVSNEAIVEGAFLPIKNCNSVNHSIFMLNDSESIEEIKQKWNFSFSYGPFNLSISNDNDLWLCNMAQLFTWDKTKFNTANNTVSYQSFDGPEEKPITLNKAIRCTYKKGSYEVTVTGLVNRTPSDNDDDNFGFLFQLKPVTSFITKNNSLDNERFPISFL